jgi:hypothetical protein
MQTIPLHFLLSSDLITNEESCSLIEAVSYRGYLSAEEVIALDLSAKNRVEALLCDESLTDKQLRWLACDFVEHILHVFEELEPEDFRPRACAEAARLYADGVIGIELLRVALDEVRPSMQRFRGTRHVGAFEVGWAVLLLDGEDARLMAQEVAVCAQRAAHRKIWENRKSNLEPMSEREKEATWQLKQIVSKLGL